MEEAEQMMKTKEGATRKTQIELEIKRRFHIICRSLSFSDNDSQLITLPNRPTPTKTRST